eukprot:TRINITY_DN1973_c0_g1_i3.p1 TRINITY_DN1973_c0_g1~~TRINITY_DN1973_c0_g1_i3.p1  ORF type:complete len:416 (-),score=83.38 TRINITY_DN1973_c0_g1_i3:180-1427(-)
MGISTNAGLVGPKDYALDPPRHPSLIVNAKAPFNAETPGKDLVSSFITPTELFYLRNHGPIPVLEEEITYRLLVDGLLPHSLSLSMDEIRTLPKHTIIASLQCAGNRRTEMSKWKPVKGVGWGFGAVGTASWGGARLADMLEMAGVPLNTRQTREGGRHVEFISVDACKEEQGGPYKASIPLSRATSPNADVLLAYEMNGQDLTRDHGFPLRVIVPGVIGARSVKWIEHISVIRDECQGFFMQLDYKMFPPTVDWHNINWSARRPIMDFPIQAAITSPLDGDLIPAGALTTITGYAVVGGGRGIERVDVSVDGGANWEEATLLPQQAEDTGAGSSGWRSYSSDDEEKLKWAWVLWKLTVPIQPPCQLVVRAVDEAANVMPEHACSIWNLRGVLNNSWHRISISLPPPSPCLPSTL